MDKAFVPTHAASEPRRTTGGCLPLSPVALFDVPPAMPLIAGAGRMSPTTKAMMNGTARATTPGAEHTNTTITCSARLPLVAGNSLPNSITSTPPACKPTTNWTSALYPPVTGSAASSASPTPSTQSSSSFRPGFATEKANVAAAAAAVDKVRLNSSMEPLAHGPSTTLPTTSTTTTTAPTTAICKAAPAQEHEVKALNNAIKNFNQRLLEEREKELARLSRRGSRVTSHDSSTSTLQVSSMQLPSVGPPPPLKPTPAAPPPAPSTLSATTAASQQQPSHPSSLPPTSSVPPHKLSGSPVKPNQTPVDHTNTAIAPRVRSVTTSGSGLGSNMAPLQPQQTSSTTAVKKAPSPPTLSLPSRYSDYNDGASSTSPPPVFSSPVYSSVEVQAPTPPTSTSASARRGLLGFGATFSDSKKDSTAAKATGEGDVTPSGSVRNRDGVTTTNNSNNSVGTRSSSPNPQPQALSASLSGIVRSHTMDDLDDVGEDPTTPDAADDHTSSNHSSNGNSGGRSGTTHQKTAEALVEDTYSLDSNGSKDPRTQKSSSATKSSPPPGDATRGGIPAPMVNVGSASATTLPLTMLPVFNSMDELQLGKHGSPCEPSQPGTPPLISSAAAGRVSFSPQRTSQPSPARPTDPGKNTALLTPASHHFTTARTTVPGLTSSHGPRRNCNGTSVSPSPASPSPLKLVSTSSPNYHPPDSALTRNGRFAAIHSRDGQGPLSRGRDGWQPSYSEAYTSSADVDAEAATLNTYLKQEELNLSMSTFNSVGVTLSKSLHLRVLNLKGSTISSEGLRGLANIPTLRSICVSHMRNLTTLIPLVTPTTAGTRCAIEEIDAQFSNIGNDGIKGLEMVRRLRRLDLSMTPISDVTCLADSISLSDLYLTGTRVDNAGMAGLEKVPTLAILYIARTKVTSLCQLAKSRSLQTLVLYSCQVNDAGFVGVGEMPLLATLDVSTTKIEDLSVLQKSRSLRSIKAQWLSLKNCQDIIQERRSQMDGVPPGDSMEWRDTEAGYAGLAAIPTLETLDLSFNTIHSIHSLCRSKSIKHLYLKRTRVENGGIGSIAQLAPTLETLVIENLTDSLDDEDEEREFDSNTSGLLSLIGDIYLLNHLTLLDLSYTDIFDLRLLQNISTLKKLIVVETLVTVDGLRGIEKNPSLELLDISQTSITSLQFLVGGAPALKKILARSNRNTSGIVLGQIHKLPALEHLDLSDSIVEDMEKVPKQCWRLKELVWRWGERRDNKGLAPPLECWVTSPRLAGLREMPCLTLLDLTNSHVHELAFLANAPFLKTLYLRRCKLLRNDAIKPLGSLAALEVLQLSDNASITDVTCLRSCRQMRELHLNNTRVNTKGLEGIMYLPELKVLNVVNTRAEDEAMHGANTAESSRLLEDSNLRDGSSVLDITATPAQFRVPRRRRVSFVASDGGEAPSKTP